MCVLYITRACALLVMSSWVAYCISTRGTVFLSSCNIIRDMCNSWFLERKEIIMIMLIVVTPEKGF